MIFFTELQQINFLWNHKGLRIVKCVLKKNNKAGGIALPDLRQDSTAAVIQTAWCWHKNRHVDRQNRAEPRNKPTGLWSTNLQQSRQEYSVKKTVSSSDETGNTESLMEISEIRTPHTLHKRELIK